MRYDDPQYPRQFYIHIGTLRKITSLFHSRSGSKRSIILVDPPRQGSYNHKLRWTSFSEMSENRLVFLQTLHCVLCFSMNLDLHASDFFGKAVYKHSRVRSEWNCGLRILQSHDEVELQKWAEKPHFLKKNGWADVWELCQILKWRFCRTHKVWNLTRKTKKTMQTGDISQLFRLGCVHVVKWGWNYRLPL